MRKLARAFLLIPAVLVVLASAALAADETVEGKFWETIPEGFGVSFAPRYFMTSSDGKMVELVFEDDGQKPGVPSGSRVRVRGRRVGGKLLVSGENFLRMETLRLQEETAAVLGPRRVLVVLVNLTGDASQPWTKPQISSLLTGSFSDFFEEASFNQVSLTGDVAGWYSLATAAADCDVSQIWSQGSQAATNDGYDLNQYDTLMFAFPFANCGGWAGLASVGGSLAWINGYMTNGLVVDHELGHNFGLIHSGSLDCGAVAYDPAASCGGSTYGDPFSTMGNQRWNHFPANFKEQLGWMTIDNITTSGTYDIAPLENVTSTRKGIRLDTLYNGSPQRYYLEYRQQTGFDADVTASAASGVLVHLNRFDGLHHLLDMTPATNTFEDAALPVGQSWSDPTGTFTITPTAATASGISVQILIGSDQTPPTVSVTAPAPAATVSDTVSVTATASDASGIAKVEFYVDGALQATDTASPYAWSWNTRLVANGVHTVLAKAYDNVGLTSNSSVLVNVANAADTTAPSVTLVTPAAGSSWAAADGALITGSDDFAVNRVELIVDGSVVAFTNLPPQASFSTELAWGAATVGAHTVQAKAYDTSNNTRTTTAINVTVVQSERDKPMAYLVTSGQTGSASPPKNLVLQLSRGAAQDLRFKDEIEHAAIVSVTGRVAVTRDRQGGPILIRMQSESDSGIPWESGLWFIRMKDRSGAEHVQPLVVVK